MCRLIFKFSQLVLVSILMMFSIAVPEYSRSSETETYKGYDVPFFYAGPESQTVMIGDRVLMGCTLRKENFQFGIYWLQDNVFLNVQDAGNPTLWVSPDGKLMGNYTLEIDNVSVDNAGDYKCVLVNGTGDFWENNLQIIKRSSVATLVVVEPELTSTAPSQPQPSTSTGIPLFEAAPMPALPEMPTTSESSPGLDALPSQSPTGVVIHKHSTLEPKEIFVPVLEKEQELDSKGSVEITPTSDSELVPKKEDEEAPMPGSNPPFLKTNSNDEDSNLPYYILVGMLIGVVLLLIIFIAMMCGKCNFKCPCKSVDLKKSRSNENEDSEPAHEERRAAEIEIESSEVKTEPGALDQLKNRTLLEVPPLPSFSVLMDDMWPSSSIEDPNWSYSSHFGTESHDETNV